MIFWKKIWHKIKQFFHILWFRKIRKLDKPLKRISINKITDNDILKLSRNKSGVPGYDNHQEIPMNMVRNKKNGVVVVIPGGADSLQNYCRENVDNYEVVESHIK